MDRTILHCDCNGFYASVECLLRPELKKVPMAVAGDLESRHGIILAKNELAKKKGVTTAETIWQARRKCPDLVLVKPHRKLYSQISKEVNAIYQRYTDLVEPFGIDESWLDITGSMHLFGGDGKTVADRLRQVVRDEIGITISVGVSFNKVFAKLGSDLKKPDATTVITRDGVETIVFPQPVTALLYVGHAASNTLFSMGIKTIGDLAHRRREEVEKRLGKIGGMIWSYARGLDDTPVRHYTDKEDMKSVGNGMTFSRDLVGPEDIKTGVSALSDTVAGRMREAGVKCRALQVQIKNPELKTISRQKTLDAPTNLAREISEVALELIAGAWSWAAPIRMITITGLNLVSAECDGLQMSLFEQDNGKRDKQERLEDTMDHIRKKFGKSAISFGYSIGSDIGVDHKE